MNKGKIILVSRGNKGYIVRYEYFSRENRDFCALFAVLGVSDMGR
jgi:hypothetical protein